MLQFPDVTSAFLWVVYYAENHVHPRGRKALTSGAFFTLSSGSMWRQSSRLVHAHVCMTIIQREGHHLSRCDVKRKKVLSEQLKPPHCWCLLTRWRGGRWVGEGRGRWRMGSWWAGCWHVGHRRRRHGLQVLESVVWSWQRNVALSLEPVGGRDLWETEQKMTTGNLVRVDQTSLSVARHVCQRTMRGFGPDETATQAFTRGKQFTGSTFDSACLLAGLQLPPPWWVKAMQMMSGCKSWNQYVYMSLFFYSVCAESAAGSHSQK